jgi:hypothetical protein
MTAGSQLTLAESGAKLENQYLQAPWRAAKGLFESGLSAFQWKRQSRVDKQAAPGASAWG